MTLSPLHIRMDRTSYDKNVVLRLVHLAFVHTYAAGGAAAAAGADGGGVGILYS